MFTTQLIGTLVVGMMNLAGLHPEIPWTSPKFKVTCDTFVIWGVIGPERIFGSGDLFRNLIWIFLIGGVGCRDDIHGCAVVLRLAKRMG